MKPKKESFFKGKVKGNAKKNVYGSSSGTGYLKLPSGISLLIFEESVKKVQMDFLPYVVTDSNHPDKDEDYGVAMEDGQWYRRPFLLHRSIGAGNKSYICLQSVGKKCPICEAQAGLWDTDRDGAIALYPKSRYLYIPIPLDSKKHEAEPVYVWDMAESLFHDTLKEALEEDDDNEAFPDLEYGKTLELTFKWKQIGENSKPFSETRHIEFLDRDPYDETILEEVPSLDEIIKESVLSYEELKAAFYETDVEKEGGELDDDDEPKEKSTSRRTRPTRKEEVEEEDEPEEKPKRTSRREAEPVKKEVSRPSRNAKPVEEEDEEDEKPKKSVSQRNSTKPSSSTRRAPVEEDDDEPEEKPVEKRVIKLTVEAKHALKEDRCVACEGSGLNSKGKLCPICGGTGLKPVKKNSAKVPANDDDCPSGYEFGKDHATQDECDDCDLWNECLEAKSKKRKK